MANTTPLPPALFLFDRDSTLVPGIGDEAKERLLNEERMRPLLDSVISGGYRWGILSTGNVDGAESNAHTAIQNAGIDYAANRPVNPTVSKGMEGVLNAIPVSSDEYTEQLRQQLSATGIHYNGKTIAECTANELHNCANIVKYGRPDSGSPLSFMLHHEQKQPLSEYGHITVEPGAVFNIQFGQTTLKLNTEQWLQTADLTNEGDNKFFQSLKAMDSLRLNLEVTDEVRALGVVAIDAPETYSRIHPSQVTMLDDQTGVVALMQAAGFHAILADTPEKQRETQNTYIDAFSVRVDAAVNTVSQDPFYQRIEQNVLTPLRTERQRIFEKNAADPRITALDATITDVNRAIVTSKRERQTGEIANHSASKEYCKTAAARAIQTNIVESKAFDESLGTKIGKGLLNTLMAIPVLISSVVSGKSPRESFLSFKKEISLGRANEATRALKNTPVEPDPSSFRPS